MRKLVFGILLVAATVQGHDRECVDRACLDETVTECSDRIRRECTDKCIEQEFTCAYVRSLKGRSAYLDGYLEGCDEGGSLIEGIPLTPQTVEASCSGWCIRDVQLGFMGRCRGAK